MQGIHRSNLALTLSVVIHLSISIIGFYFWIPAEEEGRVDRIEGALMETPKQRIKRIIPPKRIQLQKRKVTTPTDQTRLKILTSNAPVSDRGIVSAAQPTRFDLSQTAWLDQPVGLDTNIDIPNQLPAIEKPVVIRRTQEAKNETPKSRLVKFIEKQPGPQRIIYAMDLSSSMLNLNPLRLSRIRMILQDSLGFLEDHDQFNLLTFSEEVKRWRPDFSAVTETNVTQAIKELDLAQPRKTAQASDQDMLAALTSIKNTQPTIVVLFSDGILTTAGIPNFSKIKNEVPTGTKVFAMGAEMSADFPGALIMKTLSEQSGGEFWLVGESEGNQN